MLAMFMTDLGTIVQICPTAVPLYAVFWRRKGDEVENNRRLAEHMDILPCPVLALVELENGGRKVVGLVTEGQELVDPSNDYHFECYSGSNNPKDFEDEEDSD